LLFGSSSSRKEESVRERATVALANLQRNAYAMSMLRSRLESRVNFILLQQQQQNEKGGSSGGEYQEMARVLELVKNSELILNELSGKIESARFLEEFIAIIDSAAASVSGIKGDVEDLVPRAESALAQMHDAISRISGGLYGSDESTASAAAAAAEPGRAEAQQEILDEAMATVAAAAATSSNAVAPMAAVVSAPEKAAERGPANAPAAEAEPESEAELA
jgi:hypothetical protein